MIGNYRLLNQLGAGGMGTVYRAAGPDGGLVALKLLHPALASDPKARQRLQREAALINRVRSEGIAAVVDWEIDGAQPFVATEYVEGPTIAADVRAQGTWNREDLADLAAKLAEVLRTLHAANIIHRDIKPSNVMLSAKGPVLIDFGIAQLVNDERLTSTGLVTGTPGYVSPELIEGGQPSASSDWWAWAAVLVFCATGRAPFGTGAMEATLGRVLRGSPDLEGVDEEVAACLRAALRARPEDRVDPQVVVEQLAAEPGRLDLAALASPSEALTEVVAASAEDQAETRVVDANATTLLSPPAPPEVPTEPATLPATRVFSGQGSGQPVAGYGPNPALGLDAAPAQPPAPPQPEPEVPWDPQAARHTWFVPYRPPRRVLTWHMSLPLLLFAAAVTIMTGLTIPLATGVMFVILACWGILHRKLVTERVRRGYAESGDISRALVGLPGALIRALLAGAGVAALSGGGSWLAWWGIQWWLRGPDSPWSLRQALLFAEQLSAMEQALLWCVLVVAAVVGWCSPFAARARDGYQAVCAAALPAWWTRALAAVLLLVAAWVAMSTSGILGEILRWIHQGVAPPV